MPRFIGFLIVASLLQFGAQAASGDELWTYYFVADGSRPYNQPCFGDCTFSGNRADLAGTFSILLNWQTGFGKLFDFDAHIVNVASYRSTMEGEVMTPSTPSYSTASLFTGGVTPPFSDSTFSYSQGTGHLEASYEVISASQPYNITFGLTNATFSMTVSPSRWMTTNDISYIPYQPIFSIINARATLLNARVAGEFTNDNQIDARDYVAWRKGGKSQLDFNLWRKYYGTGSAVAAAAAVPEPSTLMLLVGALATILVRGRRPISCSIA